MVYPAIEKVRKLSKEFNRIPIYRELNLSELGLLSLLKALQREKAVIFLESAREDKTWSRFSFFGFNPRKTVKFMPPYVIETADGNTRRIDADIFSYLKEEMKAYKSPTYKKFGDFNGGFVGYFGFELVNYAGILRRSIKETNALPAALLVYIDDFIVHDNDDKKYYIASCLYADEKNNLAAKYDDAVRRLDDLENEIIALIKNTSLPYLPSKPEDMALKFRDSKEEFMNKVSRTREMIASGEAIQVVLSIRADITENIDPYSFYMKLRAVNPSPYMFFLRFGDLTITGSSPEIHVRVEKDTVYLKPIAGTVPQGKNRKENLENKKSLLNDPKERAEHLMLVDLARNDLGRVSVEGGVKVMSFMTPEDYSHVIHLVSLVACKLRDGKDAIDVLRETFPAGTVSGAPKVRAIEIINEMESHARDIYAGAIGYIGFNGFLDTCITIRTAVFTGSEQYLQAGAGIVYDSVPEKEYIEINNKLKALSISLQYAHKQKEAGAHVSNDR